MAAFYSWDGVGSRRSLVLSTEVDVAWTQAEETWAAVSCAPGSCSVIKGRNSLGKGEQRKKKKNNLTNRGSGVK